MKIVLKNIFDFYIDASLHVSVATSSLVLLTYYFAEIAVDWNVFSMVFFGTVFSYNFIKYFSVYLNKSKYSSKEKMVLWLTVISGIIGAINFLLLNWTTQCIAILFGLLSVFYAVPVGKLKNLRNISGIKIYIVALCWAGVTLLLPLQEAGIGVTIDVILKFFQRFILTLVLILIFEINDLKYDDIRLKTVPQTIGVPKTKLLIYGLLIPFFFLELFKVNYYPNQWIIDLILVLMITLLTYFANIHRSRYYTLFWTESIPVLWYLLILLFALF